MAANSIRVYWSRSEGDWMIDFPNRPDGHLTSGFLSGRLTFDQFVLELEGRGYDMTTLKLTVRRKVKPKSVKEVPHED